MILHYYTDSTSALRAMTNDLKRTISETKGTFHLALSGGGTAQQMFKLWVEEYSEEIEWNRLRFYWVDERCVPPTDAESNYGHALHLLFEPLQIPAAHVFRIRGEEDAEAEALRYSQLIEEEVTERNNKPHFDAIILGVGPDAHTASIFPNQLELLTDQRLYAVAKHPVSGQQRVSMTGTLILNDTPLFVPILGTDKQNVIEKLKQGFSESNATPSAYILNKATQAEIYTSQR